MPGQLVITIPNHLQALTYVDLFVEGSDFDFEDGVGIASRHLWFAIRLHLCRIVNSHFSHPQRAWV